MFASSTSTNGWMYFGVEEMTWWIHHSTFCIDASGFVWSDWCHLNLPMMGNERGKSANLQKCPQCLLQQTLPTSPQYLLLIHHDETHDTHDCCVPLNNKINWNVDLADLACPCWHRWNTQFDLAPCWGWVACSAFHHFCHNHHKHLVNLSTCDGEIKGCSKYLACFVCVYHSWVSHFDSRNFLTNKKKNLCWTCFVFAWKMHILGS